LATESKRGPITASSLWAGTRKAKRWRGFGEVGVFLRFLAFRRWRPKTAASQVHPRTVKATSPRVKRSVKAMSGPMGLLTPSSRERRG
jgi:hypothetical protein